MVVGLLNFASVVELPVPCMCTLHTG